MAAMTREQWRANAWRIVREHIEFMEEIRRAEIRSALARHDAKKGAMQ